MPSRFVRDGLLRSQRFNDLEFIEQSLYVRLILIVDDFGCFDGREEIIASQACPLWAAGDGMEAVPPALATLHRAGLILRYVNAGKPYIAITQWGSEYREYRRFPAPPLNNDLVLVAGKPFKARPKYGREISWANPPDADDVSILLDFNGRHAVPQPPEWRNLNDWSPMTMRRNDSKPVTSPTKEVTVNQSLGQLHSDCVPRLGVRGLELDKGLVADGEGSVTVGQSLDQTTATTANGEIKFENGKFEGVTEAQKLYWQGAFEDISVPVELDQAAVWLQAHPAEQAIYAQQDNGLYRFLARWFLRESKAKPDTAKH